MARYWFAYKPGGTGSPPTLSDLPPIFRQPKFESQGVNWLFSHIS